jgi:hypothetical protein
MHCSLLVVVDDVLCYDRRHEVIMDVLLYYKHSHGFQDKKGV